MNSRYMTVTAVMPTIRTPGHLYLCPGTKSGSPSSPEALEAASEKPNTHRPTTLTTFKPLGADAMLLICAARGGAKKNFGNLHPFGANGTRNNVNNTKDRPTLNNVSMFFQRYGNVKSQT